MKTKRLAAISAAVMLMLSGCGTKIAENNDIPEPKKTEKTTEATVTTVPVEDSVPEPEVTTTTAEDVKIVPAELPFAEFDITLEAETGELSGKAEVSKEREAFSGEGYVKGVDKDSGIVLHFDAPESQYYNLSVAVAAEKKSVCTLNANASHVGDFTVAAGETFSLFTFSNIYLAKGGADLALTVSSGEVDVDYAAVTASTEIRDLKLTPLKSTLVNANADYNTKALYSYLCESFGSKVLIGQHDTVGTLTETRKILEITGRSPAIRFGDLMPFTQDMIMGENEIEYAEKWASEGGIVGYMWHWTDPIGGKSYYSDETDFDLTKAVTKEKIATLPISELEKLLEEEKISEECLAIVKDIDKVSEKLKELQDKGISVIWRPLHEASNGYFWWGKTAASYKWLWSLLYQRQTNYHKLNNLIWVWSAQNAGWYVGDKQCDIISADIYDKANLSAHADRLIFLKNISANKPIVMSECGTLPSVQSIADQHAYWGYIGQWGGSFLLKEDATLNPEYNKLDDLKQFYANDITITRDELPDLKARAAELEEADKKAAEEKAAAESKAADESSKADESGTADESSKADESKTDSKADSKADSKTDSSKAS
ncbi:MAG: glycoside hydrolase [Ruminococcus sp.]|nr:glycoside hydrolase [Ruminococcus sp.]